MITKVSKVGDLYQINEGDTPIDITSLRSILKESNVKDEINNWLDSLDKEGENTFEVTANKGTVVNIYEVDYPVPSDPNKETQEISKYLDEYEDAISQQIFPGIPVEDILITTKTNDAKEKGVQQGRLFNEKELREKGKNIKRGWKELGDLKYYIEEKIKESFFTWRDLAKENDNEFITSTKGNIKAELDYLYPDVEDDIMSTLKEYIDASTFKKWYYTVGIKLMDENIKKTTSWRQILGEIETAPTPVKTPVKPKEPEKTPRINPFRKPDHIKPSKEPQPKALPVVYPPNSKLKMHPGLEQTINKKDTPYHELPQIPGGEFIENIASERFKIILRNLERYSGRRVKSLQDMMYALMEVLQKINNIEKQYIPQLEDLAVSIVEQQFGIDPREVGFDAKLVREVNLDDITNISPQQEEEFKEVLPNINVDLEVSKRRFINGLIQGAGINSLNMFHLVRDELNVIDPDLINMYGLLSAFAEVGYWVIPQSLIGSASGGVFGGGKVKLDFSQEEPQIIAVAVNFPILVQELVKGVMELLSSHGLPEDDMVREQVLDKADTLEDESWDIRFGPEIWKKLLSHLNMNGLNGRALSILYQNLVTMPAEEFSDFVHNILSNDQNSINRWNQMYEEALGNSKTSSIYSYINEEELNKEYNLYRKNALNEGETPELYYDWIKYKEKEGIL